MKFTYPNAITATRWDYQRRLDAVAAGKPHCGIKGPKHAVCILEPDHVGVLHEGDGHDAYGPKHVLWKVDGDAADAD